MKRISPLDSGNFDRSSSDVNKVISLYKFVKELSALKQTLILNVDKHHWYQPVCKLHNDPNNIELLFRDRVEEERPNVGADLLRVHKPEFQPLPQPNPVLNKWLLDGWKD